MSKAKHTAGKWKVKSGNIVSAIYANDYQVAFISGAREEHLANARLIAASPEMYEMLSEVYSASANGEANDKHLRKRILELIKKIEG